MRHFLIPAIVAASFAVTAAQADDKVLNVYNWSDYIDESLIEQFQKETGIKVNYSTYDSNDTLETKLLAGKSNYDVVVPSASNMARQIRAGFYLKLDKSKLPNLKHMWPEVMKRVANYDPGNEHSVNYMWGTTAIGYNEAEIKKRMPNAPLDSWDLIFDPEIISKFKDCGIHILDAPDEIFPAALNYLGLNPDSHKPAEIEKAAALVAKIRPYVQKFHSSEYISALGNGDICLAVGWSGDVFQARDAADKAKAGVTVGYTIPKQGALMWFDQMVIPKEAKNPEGAHKFINFMMKPENIAKATNYVYYANGNLASQPLLEKDVIEDPAIYPAKETMGRLYTTTPYPNKIQRIVNRAWTRVKSGQ